MKEITNKPWGNFEVIDTGENYKTKRITVLPHQQLSLQQHEHREEFWIVIKGQAYVTVGASAHLLDAGQYIHIPKQAIHRLSNSTNDVLEIIEIQNGDILDENDIIRLEDNYGRINNTN